MRDKVFCYSPRREKKQDLNLKRILSAIEYERVMKMRELESKRKHFLTVHCKTTFRSDSADDPRYRENLKKKITIQKKEEQESAIAIKNKSSEFIKELKEKPLLRKWEGKQEISPADESISPQPVQQDTETQPSLNSKVISLYQRGLAGLRRKEQEKKVTPFVRSVNNILEKLRSDDSADRENDSADPMKSFTKNLFGKYARHSLYEAHPIIDDSQDAQGTVEPPTGEVESSSGIENEMQCKGNIKEVDSNIKTKSSISSEMNAILQKNQISTTSIRKTSRSTTPHEVSSKNKDESSHDEVFLKTKPGKVKGDTVLNTMKPDSEKHKEGKPPLSNGKSFRLFTASLTEKTLKSGDNKSYNSGEKSLRNHNNSSPSCPEAGGVSKSSAGHNLELTRSSSPVRNKTTGVLSAASIGVRRHSTAPSQSQAATLSSSPLGRNDRSSDRKQRNKETTAFGGNSEKNGYSNPVFPQVSVEDFTHVSRSQTVIVVHEDDNGEKSNNCNRNAFQWNSGNFNIHRDTLGSHGIQSNSQKKLNAGYLDAPGDLNVEQPLPELSKSHHKTNDEENGDENDNVNDESGSNPETSTNRDELQPSTLSSYSSSFTRPRSKQGKKKERRLSIQTSGALRTLTAVLNEGNKLSVPSDSDASIRDMVENFTLNGVATGSEEQARARLGNAGRRGSISGLREEGGRRQQRSLITPPGRKNTAFLSNDVYKFLERRSSSKTNARRQTLSKLELRLLSQAPGEDPLGRRSSFSGTLDNRKLVDSLEAISGTPSVRSSVNGSCADIASNFIDNEMQKSPRRHTLSTLSEVVGMRPHSNTQCSNISENESVSGREPVRSGRNYSWAPDVSETTDWHILAMELLARKRGRHSRHRTVHHMLKCLAEEYRAQVASSIYEELRYCTYLRLTPHQVPEALKDCNPSAVFNTDKS